MHTSSGLMFKFFYRIILPSLLAILLFILTLFFIVIPVFEQAMMDRKREMIKELTNSASSILEKYYKDETEGLLTREEAQQTAISRIQYLRYGEENKDYFWITDMHPRMVMHPYVPELNGSDLTDYEDSHGKKMFVEFVDAVKDDGYGFVEYMWQWKDDSTHVVPKLSYVKRFEPWGWIIGTGIYIEDVRREISALSSRLLYISLVIVAIVALLLIFISLQSLKIEKRRQLAESNLKESREKYRSLVDASTEGLVMISDNEIIFANSIFLNLAGLDSEEISQMKWQSIFKLPAELKQKLEEGADDVETAPFETDICLPGNRKTEVLVNISPIMFYGKKAVIFSIKDISSDNQIKKELNESRERFKTLMDKLNVGIFRTTMDARGRFVEANQTAIRLMGYDNDEQLKDKYILDFFADAEDRKNFRKNLLETGFIKNQIVKLRNTDGSAKNMLVSLAVITDEAGKAAFCDGIIEPMSVKGLDSTEGSKSISIDELRSLLQNSKIADLCLPLQFISYESYIREAAETISSNANQYLLVSDNDNRILGYITFKELTAAIALDTEYESIKVYQIMKSPVPAISRNLTIRNARKTMKVFNSDVLLATDEDNQPFGVFTTQQFDYLNDLRIHKLLEGMENAANTEELKNLRSQYIRLIAGLVKNKLHSSYALQLLSDAFDSISSRLFAMAFQQFGNPPVEFAWIVMGSEGRREQTLKTDQDNAIIYSDSVENKEVISEYFLKLGTWISESLNTIGYDLCKGDNMAMNAKWNQPLSVWKKYFSNWINTGHGKDLLDINIFFDFRLSFGSEELTNELEKHITASCQSNPAFLHHLARNTAQSKLSATEVMNIKESMAVVVNFARIYALQHGITNKNTLQRLEKLVTLGVFKEQSNAETEKVMEFLTMLRLQHQSELLLNGDSPDNNIQVKQLTDFEQSTLKKALSGISTIITKLNYDFRLNI